MYADGLLSHADAITALAKLRYSEHDASLIVKLQDARTAARQVTSGVTRTRTLYNAGKIATQDAVAALVSLGIARAQAVQMVDVWAVTDVPPVRTLTESQIVSAWAYDLLPTPDALAALVTLGYDEIDAWLLLSIRNKGPLKDAPRPHGGV
jgi:Holliday junction resolvasome RuvABC DNA-binding subunit